jgi:glucuronate isomerase
MTQPYIHENFLLQTDTSARLYHDFAADLPIIDYHCHLPPAQIAEDHQFANLGQAWLAGDHYKWRAMRAAGVEERFITGDASDWEKFEKWAAVVPKTLRNPLYHWTHLELRRPFGIDNRLLNSETAQTVWAECNSKLSEPEFSARGLMRQMNVALVCTTDDPIDSLEHHAAIAADEEFAVQVLPTFRPDKGTRVDNLDVFNPWVDKLGEASDVDIIDFDTLLEAVRKRHDFFHSQGCRLSDHGLERFQFVEGSDSEVNTIFRNARNGIDIGPEDVVKFQTRMLYEFAVMNHEKGWTQQLHIGALRNNNTRMFNALGPDAGFDSMADSDCARPLSRFLDRLDRDDRLTKTIVYNLNPNMNETLATMIANFQGGGEAGKMQFGSGWWFLDQMDGMKRQIEVLSNQGLLSQFVGMLTDSRSFLSYTRHEYFRRILCNILGGEIEQGLLPNDVKLVGELVSNVCYGNASKYFGFKL